MIACDVLFVGPHPDDVEMAAAGTILRLVAQGFRCGIVDCTRGEKDLAAAPPNVCLRLRLLPSCSA